MGFTKRILAAACAAVLLGGTAGSVCAAGVSQSGKNADSVCAIEVPQTGKNADGVCAAEVPQSGKNAYSVCATEVLQSGKNTGSVYTDGGLQSEKNAAGNRSVSAALSEEAAVTDAYITARGEVFGLTGDMGTAGHLYIPDLGYSMAMDLCLGDAYTAQSVTDRYDRAAYIKYYSDWNAVIADHNDQGFSVLYSAVPGQTLAYIQAADGTVEEWICVESAAGANTEATVIDGNGYDIFADPCDGIFMYTCQEDWQHVWVTYWERVGGTWDSRAYANGFLYDEENVVMTKLKLRLLELMRRPLNRRIRDDIYSL